MRENRRLCVGNLPEPLDNHTSDLELRNLFRDYKVKTVSKVISPGRELADGSKWYVFIDFCNSEEAERAARNLNGVKMWGTRFVVEVASGRPRKALDAEDRRYEH
jgi:RNA recognition motif-containing protein